MLEVLDTDHKMTLELLPGQRGLILISDQNDIHVDKDISETSSLPLAFCPLQFQSFPN